MSSKHSRNTIDDAHERMSLISEATDTDIVNEPSSTEMVTLDEVINQIGLGKYQYIIYFAFTLMGTVEGSQITVFTLSIPILKHQWGLEDYHSSIQASLIFVGFLIGAMISGQVADRLGRKLPFLYSSFVILSLSVLTAAAQNIIQLIIIRFILGTTIGFFVPLAMSIITEITPVAQRGRYTSLIQTSISLGQIFALVVGSFLIDSFETANWRLLIGITMIPGVIAWIILAVYLDETARFCMVAGKIEEGFNNLDRMNKLNGQKTFSSLSPFQKSGLRVWIKRFNECFDDKDNASIKALFKRELSTITPILWVNVFCLSLIYYGIVIYLPQLLDSIHEIEQQEDQKNLIDKSQSFLSITAPASINEVSEMTQLIISALAEILGGLLTSIMIEVEGFGRKNSMINFGIIQGITLMMAYYDNLKRFVFWVTISKFYQTMNAIFTYQYIAEIYSTRVRTTGVGMANSVGRIGGVLMPWICTQLSKYNIRYPIFFFAFLSLFVAVITTLLPYDTLGREIDKLTNQEQEVQPIVIGGSLKKKNKFKQPVKESQISHKNSSLHSGAHASDEEDSVAESRDLLEAQKHQEVLTKTQCS